MDDFIPSILSDEEVAVDESSSEASAEENEELDVEFEEASVNDADDSMYATSAKQKKSTWDYKDAIEHIRKTERPSASVAVNIGEVIEMKRQAMKAAKAADAADGAGSDSSDSGSEAEDSEAEDTAMPGDKTRALGKDEEETAAAKKAKNFFAPDPFAAKAKGKKSAHAGAGSEAPAMQEATSFTELNLSRPLLRAVNELGYTAPTPIQCRTVPLAMAGHDVCGSAVTGSGKTAAFLLPILERLMYRPSKVAATRVLIIAPTRELATQCQAVCIKLAKFTNITSALIVGGLSLKAQETELRRRPDILVCTPGRMIDHLRNSQSVHLEELDVLVLDEADRLLEMGFSDEIHELVDMCPKSRQTLLFSATMTEQVDKLTSLFLNKPVRVSTDPIYDLADRLTQEFIRIRASREGDREAILAALLKRSFKSHVIVFCGTKKATHRLMLVLGLLGVKCAELHGNLTQRQRLEALEAFRTGEAHVLLCTDIAARGLDILGVKSVINFDMPRDMTTYVHRVGRTARAGREGCAVTLTLESERQMMKEILKRAKRNVKSRVVPAEVIERYRHKIEKLQDDVKDILRHESMEKQVRVAEMEAKRAENLLIHKDEIFSRPQRTWFQTANRKAEVKRANLARFQMQHGLSKDGVMPEGMEGDAIEEEAEAVPMTKKMVAEAAKEARRQERKEREAAKKKKPHRETRAKRRRREWMAEDAKMERTLARKQELEPEEEKMRSKMELAKTAQLTQHSKAKSKKREVREMTLQTGLTEGKLLRKEEKAKKEKKETGKNGAKRQKTTGFEMEAADASTHMTEGSAAARARNTNLMNDPEFKNPGSSGKFVFKEKPVKVGRKPASGKFKSKSRYKRRK